MEFTWSSGDTDSLTHSQMDKPECSMPLAMFFNGGGGTKTYMCTQKTITTINKTSYPVSSTPDDTQPES